MGRYQLAPGLLYLDREGWDARTEAEGYPRLGYTVARYKRMELILHHTVVIDRDATPNIWETEDEVKAKMRQLQTIRPDLGLDVPYNFVAFPMPEGIYVCEGRGEDRTGAHTHGHNTSGIGIAWQGNFELPSDVALYIPLFNKFLGWLKYDPNAPGYGGLYEPMTNLGKVHPDGRIAYGHRDFTATACPGKNLWTALDRIKFTKIVEPEADDESPVMPVDSSPFYERHPDTGRQPLTWDMREVRGLTVDVNVDRPSVIRVNGYLGVYNTYAVWNALCAVEVLLNGRRFNRGWVVAENISKARHYADLPLFGRALVQPGTHRVSVRARCASSLALKAPGLIAVKDPNYSVLIVEERSI
ncbi:MAG: hypothetical protein ACE5JU_19865 [Candidatus Binatia bacterium]